MLPSPNPQIACNSLRLGRFHLTISAKKLFGRLFLRFYVIAPRKGRGLNLTVSRLSNKRAACEKKKVSIGGAHFRVSKSSTRMQIERVNLMEFSGVAWWSVARVVTIDADPDALNESLKRQLWHLTSLHRHNVLRGWLTSLIKCHMHHSRPSIYHCQPFPRLLSLIKFRNNFTVCLPSKASCK